MTRLLCLTLATLALACSRPPGSTPQPTPRPRAAATPTPIGVPPAPTERPVYQIGGEVSEPIEISRINPLIPDNLKTFQYRGILIFGAVIEADGTVSHLKHLRPVPAGARPCVAAYGAGIARWRYKPALRHGLPVAVTLTVTVTDNGC